MAAGIANVSTVCSAPEDMLLVISKVVETDSATSTELGKVNSAAWNEVLAGAAVADSVVSFAQNVHIHQVFPTT